MRNVGIQICLFLILLWSFSSFAFSKSLKKDLRISLQEKRIQDFSISGLSLVFYVNISNSSSSHYYLTRYEFRFVVNQQEYLRLQTSLDESIRIAARGNTLLSFPLKITYAHLFQTVAGIEDKDKGLGYLAGSMVFSDGRKEKGRLPFTFSGEFPIFKKPDIEFISVKVNDMTIGGADLNVEVAFKNSNSFEFLVDKISYKLHLGEKLVGEEKISGDKDIKSQGEKIFSLPLLLNFFEVGKESYYSLRQPFVFCSLSGEIDVRTIWGKVKIPFDKSGKVSILRAP